MTKARWTHGTRAAIAGLALALAGCEPSMQDVLAEHRPATERAFARLAALEAAARDLPPLTEDRIALDGARVRLYGDDSNALFLRAGDLAAPEQTTTLGDGGTHSGTVAGCGEALRGEFRGTPVGARAHLRHCGRAEYAFVLRPVFPPPAPDGSFDAFAWHAEVLLFRLADAAPLGGFRVSTDTRGDTTVLIRDGREVAGSARTDDPTAKTFVAIDDGLRKHVPGVLEGA